MNLTIAVWILIVFAFAAANLPFFTQRLFGLIPVRAADLPKPAWQIIIEMIVLYGVTGLLGFAFERSLANPFSLQWEFYAITLCIFVVLSFPGFIYRYLLK